MHFDSSSNTREIDFTHLTRRLAIQFEVRRLKRHSRGADFLKIQDMRLALVPLLATLKELQEAAGAYPSGAALAGCRPPRPAAISAATRSVNGAQSPPSGSADEALMYWDDFNDIADNNSPAHPDRDLEALIRGEDDVPPEHTKLVLPSNGNTDMDFEMPEIAMRKKTAQSLLAQIRELIADKSFRYTEHMRAAPRKGVRTRARTTIDDLDRKLSLLCQIYTYCRDRLIDLRVDREVLAAFRVLTHEDVRCSTAILSPNLPGSTKLTLSWIWQSIDRRFEAGEMDDIDTDDPVTLLECKSTLFPGSRSVECCRQFVAFTGYVRVLRHNAGRKNRY